MLLDVVAQSLKPVKLLAPCKRTQHSVGDVTKTGTGSGKRGTGNGERKSGNELSAETSTKIQNGGPKNETEKEEDKERNLCLG